MNRSTGLCSLIQSKCRDIIILGDIFSSSDYEGDSHNYDQHSVSTDTNIHLH